MKLFTSYYGSRSLDRQRHFLVRISNSSPKAFTVDAVLQDAVPDWDTIVKPYKEGNLDNASYHKLYRQQLESKAFSILLSLTDIAKASGGKDIVLLCYEKPGEFCHRRIFSKWLEEQAASLLSIIPELDASGVEELGTGQLTLF